MSLHKQFSFKQNPNLLGLQCLRCLRITPVSLFHSGCLACKTEGHFVSLAACYTGPLVDVAGNYRNLPYLQPLRLGESNTPVFLLPELAQRLGVRQLTIKDESRNPTGSHKDRMSAYGIAQAIDSDTHTIVLASSGNAAISAAHYARHAGLACEIAVYDTLHRPYEEKLNSLGAKLFRFSDNAQRWAFVDQRAKVNGYFALTNHHLPALGSAPLSIEGYKEIAYEVFENNQTPDHLLVPTARGDLAWGIMAGFIDLLNKKRIESLPKVWIVEPFSRLSSVLGGTPLHDSFAGTTKQFSTSGATVTYLQKQVVERTNSGALVVSDEAAEKSRTLLIEHGFWPELCAAACLDAALQLQEQNMLKASDNVMLIMTSNLDRDPSYQAPKII
jgi:threonine synthase